MKIKIFIVLAALAVFAFRFGINASAATAVSTPEQLMNMESDGDYYLTQNINLGGVKWKPIADFSGTLDGNGYGIDRLTSENYGLFVNLSSGAEIRDVKLRAAYITSKYKTVGGIAAVIESGAEVKIDNCFISGVVASCRSKYNQPTKGSTAGAIVGKNNSSKAVISNCYSNAVVGSEKIAGGIAGVNRGTIKSCGFEGQITHSYNVYELAVNEGEGKNDIYSYLYCSGGIAGISYGKISNSFSGCTGLELGTYYGGIAGALQKNAKVSYCVNSSEVPFCDIGGGLIAGYAPNSSEISDCYTRKPTENTVQNDVGKGKKDTVTYGVSADKYGERASFKRLDSDWEIWDGEPKLEKLKSYFLMEQLYEIKGERLVRTDAYNDRWAYNDDEELSVDYGYDEFGNILE